MAVSPSPIPTAETAPLPGNRVRQFDFGSIRPGAVLHVQTGQSNWYFTRTANSRVLRNQVTGVFVQTDSKAFGQITRNPANVTIDRVFQVGSSIYINGQRATGGVSEMFLDGVELT